MNIIKNITLSYMKQYFKKNIFFILINSLLIVFFFFLLSSVDVVAVLGYFELIPFWVWFLFFCSILITYFLKSLRFKILNKNIKTLRLFYTTINHNFFLNLLPFRLGEIYYLKELKKDGVSVLKSAGDIVVVRALDFSFIFLVAFLVLDNFNEIVNFEWFFVILLILFFILFIFVDKFIEMLPLRVHDKLSEFKKISIKNKLFLLIITFFVWFFSFFPWIVILIILFSLTIKESIIINLSSLLFSLLPINPPAGMGVIESGWISGFYLVGISGSDVISFSVFAHSIFLIFVIFLYILNKFLLKKYI